MLLLLSLYTILAILSIPPLFALDFALHGHRDAIWRITLHQRDGKLTVYSCGADGALKSWKGDLTLTQSLYTHSTWARSLAVDDRFVAVGGYKPDNVIRILDRRTFRLVKELRVHSGSVFTMTFHRGSLISAGSDNWIVVTSADLSKSTTLKFHDAWVREVATVGDYLVSVDESGTIVVTDLKSLRRVYERGVGAPISAITCEGSFCLVGDTRGNLYQLTILPSQDPVVKKLQVPARTEEIGEIGGLCLSRDVLFVASGPYVFSFRVTRSGLTRLGKFRASPIEVTALACSDDALFVGDKYGEIYVFSHDGTLLRKSPRHREATCVLALLKNFLAVGRESGSLELYDALSGRLLNKVALSAPIRSLAFHGDALAAGTGDGSIHFFKTGTIARTIRHVDAITTLHSTKSELFAGSYEVVISIDPSGVRMFRNPILVGSWVTSLHGSGELLYVGTNTGVVAVFKKNDRNELLLLAHHSVYGAVVGFTTVSNRTFILTNVGTLYTVKGTSRPEVYQSLDAVSHSLFAHDNVLFVAGEGLYEVPTAPRGTVRALATFEAPIVSLVGSQHSLFACLSNGQVLELRREQGVGGGKPSIVRRFLPDLFPVTTLMVADSSTVVSGHENGTIVVWKRKGSSSQEFEVDKVLNDHTSSVRDLAIVGELIVSASADRTIKLWNMRSGLLEGTLLAHGSYVWTIELWGDRLFSGDWSGRIIEWDLRTRRVVRDTSVGGSVSDLKVTTDGTLYFATLEGEIGRLRGGTVEKRRLTEKTLWTVTILGGIVFTAGWDGLVFALDGSLRLMGTVKTHNSTVFKLETLDGQLISAGSDNTVRLWKVVTKGKEVSLEFVSALSDFRQSLLAVALSRETAELVLTTGTEVKAVRLRR